MNRNLSIAMFRWRALLSCSYSVGLVLIAGCAFHPLVHRDFSNRLATIKTVAVSPPYLVCYSQWGSSSHADIIPLPEGAIDNVAAAVREEFGRVDTFTLQDLDLWNSSLAPQTPPWIGSGPPATPLNPHPPVRVGAPLLFRPEGMNFRPQTFPPQPAEPGADAALFICGWQKTRTTGALIEQFVFGPEILPLDLIESLCMPGNPQKWIFRDTSRREVCIGLCLTDCRTGEVLWSDIEMGYGLLDIKNPETANKLVAKACGKFLRLASQPSSQ
jgi:hypothetical protein